MDTTNWLKKFTNMKKITPKSNCLKPINKIRKY